jgi:hypothetical protein
VSSQDAAHPVFVMAYMVDPYDFDDSVDGGHEGSSAMSAVPPVDHWGVRYDLFMPYNYPASELVLVRAVGGADVTLDCAGVVTGWQSIDAGYEFTRVWVSRDTNGAFNPQVYTGGTCDNGIRSLTSTGAFGVTAYGWISLPFAAFGDVIGGSSYAYSPLTSHTTIVASDGGMPP